MKTLAVAELKARFSEVLTEADLELPTSGERQQVRPHPECQRQPAAGDALDRYP